MQRLLITTFTALMAWQAPSQAADHSAHAAHGGAASHDHGDNPVLFYGELDRLEGRLNSEEEDYHLDAQGWIGTDLNKLWLKTDLSHHGGEIAEAELQALYSRAVAAYWNLELGIRTDIKPRPSQDWLVLGVQGLAPYWFEVDAALFIGSGGKSSARLSAEYEILLTQRLTLSPEVSLTAYGQNDPAEGTGAGLAQTTASLRLGYSLRREFTPYLGVNWLRYSGQTSDYVRQGGEAAQHTHWVLGIQAWF